MTERMAKYEWREGMGEISGFGGGYEACCRAVLKAGLEFCDEQGDAFDPKYGVPRAEGIEFFGVAMDMNEDASKLDKALQEAAEPLGGLTGAMHQAIVGHIGFVRKEGWERYVEEMSRRDDGEGEER